MNKAIYVFYYLKNISIKCKKFFKTKFFLNIATTKDWNWTITMRINDDYREFFCSKLHLNLVLIWSNF